MEATEIIDVVKQAIYVLITVSSPIMMASLAVGLIVALFQTLTQIQEATLTFVPKMITMLLLLAFLLPFIMQTLVEFNNRLQDKIVHIE